MNELPRELEAAFEQFERDPSDATLAHAKEALKQAIADEGVGEKVCLSRPFILWIARLAKSRKALKVMIETNRRL